MSFKLGVFDVFASTVPGSVLVVVLTYVGWRLGLGDDLNIGSADSLLLLAIGFVASLLGGLLIYPLGRWASQRIRSEKLSLIDEARANFRNGHSAQSRRPFVDADIHVLLSALQVKRLEAFGQVELDQAQAIMLRSSAVAFALGAATPLLSFLISDRRLLAAFVLVLLASASVAPSVCESHRRTRWAYVNALRLAAWLPDIDQGFR